MLATPDNPLQNIPFFFHRAPLTRHRNCTRLPIPTLRTPEPLGGNLSYLPPYRIMKFTIQINLQKQPVIPLVTKHDK